MADNVRINAPIGREVFARLDALVPRMAHTYAAAAFGADRWSRMAVLRLAIHIGVSELEARADAAEMPTAAEPDEAEPPRPPGILGEEAHAWLTRRHRFQFFELSEVLGENVPASSSRGRVICRELRAAGWESSVFRDSRGASVRGWSRASKRGSAPPPGR